MPHRIIIDRDVAVPMRDGIQLMADIYRPALDQPLPALVVRLPYGKSTLSMQLIQVEPLRASEAGYAVVYQDTRGRFQSAGDFYPFVHEAQDGYDTVEWVASQPWCNGRVGLTGASYVGISQWLTAALQPPHLRAMFPIVSPSQAYDGMIYQGGAFQLGFTLLWTLLFLAPDLAARRALLGDGDPSLAERLVLESDRIGAHYDFTPLASLPVLRDGDAAQYYLDWIACQARDGYWNAIDPTLLYRNIQVPAFNVGGWYDLFLLGTLENYTRMRQKGRSQVSRAGQRLLVGPWAYGLYGGVYPDRSYGVCSSSDAVDLTGLQIRCFDHHLKGGSNGPADESPVQVFVMGEDRWRDEDEWPLARTQYEKWYLRDSPQPGASGGRLSSEPPSREEPDTYRYDPRNPLPTLGGPSFLPGLGVGADCGPKDQRPIEAREDVISYTSAPLNRPIGVTGPLEMVLFAGTDAPDTDFVARLCDVYPDGVSCILAEGILRARFRDGLGSPSPVKPGEVVVYRINLVATSNVFLAGDSVRVDIASGSFPRFDRNPNTSRPTGHDGPSDYRVAVQTIFHDSAHPSHIVLPVIPR